MIVAREYRQPDWEWVVERSRTERCYAMFAAVRDNFIAGAILPLLSSLGVSLGVFLKWIAPGDDKSLTIWPAILLMVPMALAVFALPYLVLRLFRRGSGANAPRLSAINAVTVVHGFIGRVDVLKEIQREFKRHKRIVLRGGPGMGKTSTAQEYAAGKAWARSYDDTGWIDASEPEKIIAGLVRQALDWNVARHGDDTDEDFAQSVLNAIGKARGRYLLVYDNVDSEESLAALKRLQHPRNVDLLITSLFDNWSGQAKQIWLEKLPPEDAIRLLEERSGRTSDRRGAASLVKTLGYLPLAIEHAGTLGGGGTAFATYEDKLRQFLRHQPKGATYPRSVYATVRLAVARAREASVSAPSLLLFLAHCAPNDIPMSLAEGSSLAKDGESGARTFAKALEALVNVSLVRIEAPRAGDPASWESAISMHRLVQLITLDYMRHPTRQAGKRASASPWIGSSEHSPRCSPRRTSGRSRESQRA